MKFTSPLLENFIISCYDREVTPKPNGDNGSFPNWTEIFWALGRVNRFCGRQNRNIDWNVLKHSLCVALLSGDFIPGLLHDWPEMFTNDTPTPFKTEAQRLFEKECYILMGMELKKKIPTFPYQAFLNSNYKPADSIMVDYEATKICNFPERIHSKYFKYNPETYNGKIFSVGEVSSVFNNVYQLPSEIIEQTCTIFMENICHEFYRNPYDQKIVDDMAENLLDTFNLPHNIRELRRRAVEKS